MKKFFTFTILLVTSFCFLAQAQDKKDQKKITDMNTEKDLLPPATFDKMIIQDITYAIFGESSPVSGIKIDITKPEATISGVFQSKKKPSVLVGFDFKGGITDKNFSIFKGQNSFNTAFELKPSVHIIPSCNSAKFYGVDEPILRVRNQLIEKETRKLTDSFYVMALIYNKHLKKFPKLVYTNENLPADSITETQTKLLIYFIKKTLKDYNLDLNESSLDALLNSVPQADENNMNATYNDNIFKTYKKYEALYDKSDSDQLSKQIENVSSAWTKKNYWWITISPFARTEKINEYHTKYKTTDSLYFKSNHHFYYGLNAMINNYILWPNKKVALFWRAAAGVSYANNLPSLSSFTYESTTPFFTDGTTATAKTKSGTAYNYDDINSDFVTQFSGEVYLLPLKSFLPGLYFSSSINASKLYNLPTVINRGNDKILIPMEGGLVFNINSREKDKEKSVLSISFYSRFEDVTDKTRVSVTNGTEETKEDFMKRNLSFGLKVGIPITLPQRSN